MLHRLCFSPRCRFCSEMQGCVVLCFMARSSFNRRPLAATYLCRFAAKARFDNRQPPEGVSKEGGPQPSLFGRFKVRGFLRGEGNRNPSPLKWRSLDTFFRQEKKVSRRRQKRRKKSHRADRVLRPYAYPSNAPIKATKRRTASRRFSLHITLTAPPSPC